MSHYDHKLKHEKYKFEKKLFNAESLWLIWVYVTRP